jgi:hypothetical protein
MLRVISFRRAANSWRTYDRSASLIHMDAHSRRQREMHRVRGISRVAC